MDKTARGNTVMTERLAGRKITQATTTAQMTAQL
jgi:hypothetical protein